MLSRDAPCYARRSKFMRLPAIDFRNASENHRFSFAPDHTIFRYVICPPLQLPDRITFTTFANTSILIASASHYFGLPASDLAKGVALLFRVGKYSHKRFRKLLGTPLRPF